MDAMVLLRKFPMALCPYLHDGKQLDGIFSKSVHDPVNEEREQTTLECIIHYHGHVDYVQEVQTQNQ